MLKLVKSPRDLPPRGLMDIYLEDNQAAGAEDYPHQPPARQLQLAEEDFWQYLSQVFFPTPGAVYALWEAEGRPVSALRLEPYRDGLLLEGLATRPDFRRRGCAGALIGAVQALPEVERLYAHVEKRNRPSLAVHKQCGFRVTAEYARYIDGSVDPHACTLVWER